MRTIEQCLNPNITCTYVFSDAPHVELALGASISPDSVYEGGDVYFDCRIRAQPRPRKILWQFNVSKIVSACG